jgi:acyl-CoA thioesterase-1
MTNNTAIAFRRSVIGLFFLIFSLPVLANSNTILIMGDSLSAGYGVQTEDAWVSLLRQRLAASNYDQWQVANASISGETTDGGLRRLPDLLERHDPEVVIIELGGNDGLRGFQPRITRKNLQKMIDLSQTSDARVLLVGMQLPPNYGERFTKAFAAIFPELAESENTALVPFFLKGVYNVEGAMQDDGIHPTSKGQPRLLDNVWPELEPLLKEASR